MLNTIKLKYSKKKTEEENFFIYIYIYISINEELFFEIIIIRYGVKFWYLMPGKTDFNVLIFNHILNISFIH